MAARSIEMSTAGLVKWQAVLTAKKIETTNQLLDKAFSIDSEPTARKALRGEKLDKTTWVAIFQDLTLKRGDFFTDAEWHDWSLENRWEMLLNLAEEASARFGLVFSQQPEQGGVGDVFREERFQTSMPSGTLVLLEIPAGLSSLTTTTDRVAMCGRSSCVSQYMTRGGDLAIGRPTAAAPTDSIAAVSLIPSVKNKSPW